MNLSHLAHAFIALLIQAALWSFVGPWGAAAAGVMFYFGREITQHEYMLKRIQRQKPDGGKPVRWHEGFWKGWSLDSTLDLLAPAIACGLAAYFGGSLF